MLRKWEICKNKNEINGGLRLGLGKGLTVTEMREFITVMKNKKKSSQIGLW